MDEGRVCQECGNFIPDDLDEEYGFHLPGCPVPFTED